MSLYNLEKPDDGVRIVLTFKPSTNPGPDDPSLTKELLIEFFQRANLDGELQGDGGTFYFSEVVVEDIA